MQVGLYEQLITKLILSKLDALDRKQFHISERVLDKSEASKVLSQHLCEIIRFALEEFAGNDNIKRQIEVANKIILLIRDEVKDEDFNDDLVDTKGRILSAILSKIDSSISDFEKYIHEITPYTKLTQSELFTGSNLGLSIESEIRKEIQSADNIYFIVSFIKWSGLRIFSKELQNFTEKGGRLKVITTSYMGATDFRSVEFLSKLKNAEVKISYNKENERLHAKAYLFLRNTGFDTGYIGSSNISRSALTSGLEWNLKVTTKQVAHIIDKFKKTFETYWLDRDFETFEAVSHSEKLKEALRVSKTSEKNNTSFLYFEISPFFHQKEILEKLQAERLLHNRFQNLIVAATGTGKTVISAFDFKNFQRTNPRAKLLFVAHRKEILEQAQLTFRGILRDNNFGDLWVDGLYPERFEHLFASVMSLKNSIHSLNLSHSYFDFIIIDEVHHIAASSYRPILQKFTPTILLGLTATPERMDGEDITTDFCGVIATEIRLTDALNQKLLSPFQYFGITDSIDLSNVEWRNGKYLPSELSKIYTRNDNRVGEILQNLEKYLTDKNDVRALGFCVDQEHAKYMAEKFCLAGIKSDYLVSENSRRRDELKRSLLIKDINYLFVVDIFNEGVDIPEIDTVLFLRPTESLTVFLQQLGRGLRLADGKDCLTVLDFVGNSRDDYDFEQNFRALIGKTNTSIQKEIENDFPHLPLGCSIVLERKAKEYVLKNISKAISINTNQIINKLSNFKHQTDLPLSLKNFLNFYRIPLQTLYRRGNWQRLCVEAKQRDNYSSVNEKEISRAIRKKWLSCKSTSYYQFILTLAKQSFNVQVNDLSEEQRLMCLMLHYDVWQEAGGFPALQDSILAMGKNEVLVEEIIEFLEYALDDIDFLEINIDLPYKQPLKVHSRYTRDQILAAFGYHTFDEKRTSREGVVELKEKNTELLLITLDKSEGDFSPTTMYDDFAISETLFHWQSQNSTRPEKGKGVTYIRHQEIGKRILLFARERNEDEFGITMGYVFLGEGNLSEHYGSKPMSIKWELKEPIPPYLWKDSAKMAI